VRAGVLGAACRSDFGAGRAVRAQTTRRCGAFRTRCQTTLTRASRSFSWPRWRATWRASWSASPQPRPAAPSLTARRAAVGPCRYVPAATGGRGSRLRRRLARQLVAPGGARPRKLRHAQHVAIAQERYPKMLTIAAAVDDEAKVLPSGSSGSGSVADGWRSGPAGSGRGRARRPHGRGAARVQERGGCLARSRRRSSRRDARRVDVEIGACVLCAEINRRTCVPRARRLHVMCLLQQPPLLRSAELPRYGSRRRDARCSRRRWAGCWAPRSRGRAAARRAVSAHAPTAPAHAHLNVGGLRGLGLDQLDALGSGAALLGRLGGAELLGGLGHRASQDVDWASAPDYQHAAHADDVRARVAYPWATGRRRPSRSWRGSRPSSEPLRTRHVSEAEQNAARRPLTLDDGQRLGASGRLGGCLAHDLDDDVLGHAEGPGHCSQVSSGKASAAAPSHQPGQP
jgi:hypothetical protein